MELGKVSLKDDISAVAAKMEKSLKLLDDRASVLFVASRGNLKTFSQGLKNNGVEAGDAALLVQKYGKALADARKESLGLADSSSKLASTLKQVGIGAARGVGEKLLAAPGALLGGAFGIVESIGSKVVDVGKDLIGAVIDAAQFRQNAITGLEYMLGTRQEAERIFADAQKLAQDTPLDTDKVITGIKELVTSGFSGDESLLLFKAVADQAAKFTDPGRQEKVIAAFSRVKGRGVATGEDLESFRVAGFRAENIVEQLRTKENLAPLFKNIKADASQEDIIKQVKKVLGEGKIGSTTFLNAALASLEKDKPDLGEYAKLQGKVSLTGTISNFKSAFSDLLKSPAANIENWKGVKSFQNFLTTVTEALQSNVGKQLLGTIQHIIDSLLGGLDSIKSKDIEGFVATIAKFGESAVGFIKEAWGWLDRLLHSEPGAFVDNLKDVLVDMGRYIGQGLYVGFKSAALGESADEYKAKVGRKLKLDDVAVDLDDKRTAQTIADAQAKVQAVLQATSFYPQNSGAYGAGVDAAAGFELGARTELDSHSPSRTMARVGEDAARGLVLGVQGGTDKGAADLRSRGGGMGFQMGDIIINGVAGDADAVAAAVQSTLEREMLAFWERRALES